MPDLIKFWRPLQINGERWAWHKQQPRMTRTTSEDFSRTDTFCRADSARQKNLLLGSASHQSPTLFTLTLSTFPVFNFLNSFWTKEVNKSTSSSGLWSGTNLTLQQYVASDCWDMKERFGKQGKELGRVQTDPSLYLFITVYRQLVW